MRRIILVAIPIFLIIIFFSGCTSKKQEASSFSETESTTFEEEKMKITITLIKNQEEIESETFETSSENKLITVLGERFELEEDNGMITSINGIEQNVEDGYYWVYTINGEMINTGAKDTELKDGDKVVFTYEQF
jgi:FtsZ-interacting cell division protein ZipA